MDAQKWTQLRRLLKTHIDSATQFSAEYTRKSSEIAFLKDVKRALDYLRVVINEQLDMLDETSPNLIEIVILAPI